MKFKNASTELNVESYKKIIKRKDFYFINKASRLIKYAEKVAQSLIKKSEQEIQLIHEKAYQEGFSKGKSEGFLMSCEKINAHFEKIVSDNEAITQLVSHAINSVIDSMNDDAQISQFVAIGLKKICVTNGLIQIHIHPKKVHAIQALVSEWKLRFPHLTIEVIPDHNIDKEAYQISGGKDDAKWIIKNNLALALAEMKTLLAS